MAKAKAKLTKTQENVLDARARIEATDFNFIPANQRKKIVALACRRVYEQYRAEQKAKVQK